MNAEWEARLAKLREETRKRKEKMLSERNADEPTLIKSILGKYKNLSEETAKEHWLEILDIEDEQEKCKKCGGLDHCHRMHKGHFPYIQDDQFVPYFSTGEYPCRYERQRREQAKIDRLLVSSGVPRIYENLSFDAYTETPDNRKAVKAAHWIVGNDSDASVYLHGSKGTGKTMLASIATNEMIRRGKVVLFSSVPDLMADIRASFKADNTDEIINSVKNAPILVLDDLGAERATEWVGEQLFAIVNARYAGRKKTVITSNYAPDEPAAHFVDKTQGERIVSRIYGMCARVKISGKDWRMAG